MTLYRLTLTDYELSYSGYTCSFQIGVFNSFKEAENTGRYYLTSIPGFSEYPCSYHIDEIILEDDHVREPATVYQIWGYDINKNGDEVNGVEEFHTDYDSAVSRLEALQSGLTRDEWGIDKIKIGLKNWQEGFARG